MANKKYPRIGRISWIDYPKGRCLFCNGNEADTRIDVEFNCMRGDDDVYKVHRSCIENLTNDQILAKIKFI